MARVKLLTLKEMQPELRQMFEKMEARGFELLNVHRALAHSPELCQSFMRLVNRVLFKAKLDPRLREVAILRVAHLTQAGYERDQHEDMARRLGLPDPLIAGVKRWQTARHFSPAERAVLQYTDELTRNIRARKATFQRLQKFLSEQEIVELTLTIGTYNLLSRFLEALQVDLESKRFSKS